MPSGKWEEHDRRDQLLMAKTMIAGSKQSPENLNRALQQLADNPSLVERYSKEAGIDDGEEVGEIQDESTTSASEGIDAAVDASLRESGSMSEPGQLEKTDNADLEERVRQLENILMQNNIPTPRQRRRQPGANEFAE